MLTAMRVDDCLSIVLRLMLSLLVGGAVGLERESRHKPAGLRTHMLVSFGSALFVLANLKLSDPQAQLDPSRTIQGIAAGIGFLGAGEIMRTHRNSEANEDREEVRGLTSAAAIWVSAALGTLAGCGLWQISLIGGVLAYAVLKLVKKVEKYF